jgi:hypothetical protein
MAVGGLKYIYSSMSPPAIEDAKADIQAAVFGLILALASYLILFTINPNLLKLDFTVTAIPSTTSPGPTPTPGPGPTPKPPGGFYTKNAALNLLDKTTDESNWTNAEKAALYSHAEALKKLNDNGIAVTGSGGLCPDQNNFGCTSLNGLPKEEIDTLIQIKKDYADCNITVTGGTEKGHTNQGFGKASMDLKYDLALYYQLSKKKL